MAKVKCARQYYTKAKESQLDERAIEVSIGLANHPLIFAAPPVNATQLRQLAEQYILHLNAYKRGGLDQKAAYFTAKENVTEALHKLADYVDALANGHEETIIQAGFVPTKTTRLKAAVPGRPKKVTAQLGNAEGEMWVGCEAIRGALFYVLIAAEGAPVPQLDIANGQLQLPPDMPPLVIDTNKARKKKLTGLKPGVVYYLYMYAGNNNGNGPLSFAVQQRAV